MKNFEKLDKLLRSTPFESLSNEDREWVEHEISEEEYKGMFRAIHQLRAEKEMQPSGRTKAQLISLIKGKQQSNRNSWIYTKTPLYANFIILLVVIPLIWVLLPQKEVIVEKPVAVNVPVYDTVLVHLPPDTVLVEKTVRVEVPIYLTRNSEPKSVDSGVLKKESFAEQKALHDLLVSGE
ncbi:hypothetical protein SAMN05421640_3353 [Ekhidna lutea]|uniref:Uncharacterized protein n=1 Tax=Ekhidna lutea TaxID=447679 RepID=A0A239LL08_EKHLU|nr:hypothetical protein [Ekhidna lutea]SNT31141.1 hypothetical protein SAMN05421640_3353 [Ekhidna lutea]